MLALLGMPRTGRRVPGSASSEPRGEMGSLLFVQVPKMTLLLLGFPRGLAPALQLILACCPLFSWVS